jgi:TIR domain
MRVFLSWSGGRSKQVAEILRYWLPSVLQAVRPYFSPEDVSKGSRWSVEIAKELRASKAGIICLTRDNLASPWLMFEAGAIVSSLDRSRVIPLLLDVPQSDIGGPLAQFQMARFERNEIEQTVQSLNELLEDPLPKEVLSSAFETWWPKLERSIGEVATKQGSVKRKRVRSDREVLDEVLYLLRAELFRSSSNAENFQKIIVEDALTSEDLSLGIDELELASDVKTALVLLGIETVHDLVSRSDVAAKFGSKFVRGVLRMVIHRRSLGSGFADTRTF